MTKEETRIVLEAIKHVAAFANTKAPLCHKS